jgi:hypothetical protein
MEEYTITINEQELLMVRLALKTRVALWSLEDKSVLSGEMKEKYEGVYQRFLALN